MSFRIFMSLLTYGYDLRNHNTKLQYMNRFYKSFLNLIGCLNLRNVEMLNGRRSLSIEFRS